MKKKRPTFQKLLPELRSALADYLKRARRKDRQSPNVEGWVSQTRGMEEYLFCLGIMLTNLDGWLVKKSMKSDVQVFEAGIGDFIFGRELLQRYGAWMKVDGLRLTYSDKLRDQKNLKQRVGMLESASTQGRFDLIISARGAFVYSLNSFAAIEEMIRSMKIGAIAYVDDAKLLLPKAWFRNFLKQEGIEIQITRYERGDPYAYRIQNNRKAPLDLSPFSRRYVQALNINSSVILRWGFDRTVRQSPLTAVLSSLYEEERYSDLWTAPVKTEDSAGGSKRSIQGRDMEVWDIGGVTYVNDAQSQTFAEAEEAMGQWADRRILWISGGEGVLIPGEKRPQIHGGLFFGAQRKTMAEKWSWLSLCFTSQELKQAIEQAYHAARPRDVVLFSPGIPPEADVHGTCANRAADFRQRIRELQELDRWNGQA